MRLGIVIGSARKHRRSGRVADYVFKHAKAHSDFDDVVLLDTADYQFKLDLPSGINGNPDYNDPTTKRWSAQVQKCDAFIFVMPEYNHGYSPALKLAIDYLFAEWGHKPVALISQGGGVSGGRSIENILPVLKAVHLVVVNQDIRLSKDSDLDDEGNVVKDSMPKLLDKQLETLFRYSKALQPLREQ